jgi:hypothetical protein
MILGQYRATDSQHVIEIVLRVSDSHAHAYGNITWPGGTVVFTATALPQFEIQYFLMGHSEHDAMRHVLLYLHVLTCYHFQPRVEAG